MLVAQALSVHGTKEEIARLRQDIFAQAKDVGYIAEDVFGTSIRIIDGDESTLYISTGVPDELLIMAHVDEVVNTDTIRTWNEKLEKFSRSLLLPLAQTYLLKVSLSPSEEEPEDWFSAETAKVLRSAKSCFSRTAGRQEYWAKFIVMAAAEGLVTPMGMRGIHLIPRIDTTQLKWWLMEDRTPDHEELDEMMCDYQAAHRILTSYFQIFREHRPPDWPK